MAWRKRFKRRKFKQWKSSRRKKKYGFTKGRNRKLRTYAPSRGGIRL